MYDSGVTKMSLVAVPFYQKRHKHFDQSYRNIQTRYLLDEYSAKKKRASAQSSLQRSVTRKSSSQRESSRAALGESTLGETTLGETSLGDTTLGRTTCPLCAKRMSSALEEEAQERKRRYQSMVAAYGEAKRERYLSELAQLEEDVHVARTHARDQLDRLALQHAGRHGLHHAVDDRLAWERHSFEERISRAPEILVRLRSHTVWERMSVKLCFTVQGFPTPVVQWYKDGSLICQAGEPGKYRIDSKYGVHTLEINRADFDDTATYSAVATNVHGQVSTNAAVVVRRFRGDEEPFHSVGLPIGLPLSSVIPYTHFDVQFIEKFGVTFRREGETLTLKCTLLVTPDLKRVQPRAEWYRDGPNTMGNTTKDPMPFLSVRCEVGTDNWIQCNDAPVKICKYPVTGLFEGRSYIFRVRAVNSAGISRPSRVSEAVAALDPVDLRRLQAVHLEGEKDIVVYQEELEGEVQIPGPPTNVHASETSRTYVVLSWDPPEPRGKEPLMYFIEKSMVGSGSWQRVNAQTAVRSPRYAVFDLAEGKPYVFRVLSANKHGLSDPSEITAPIQAQDTIVVPSAPGRVLASRNTRTSVVVQWDRPKHEEDLLGYYVDCSVAGSNVWEPCNHKPIGYNRFVVHGLTTGEQYIFRVKAVNAVGTSENSQESDVIKVQAALTVPSHPYGITLLNCDGHSMILGWKVPKFSGGSPILGYYVDKREAHHKNWHEVNSSPLKERILTVEGLTEGSLYEFKIAAANMAGIGQPSDPSELFKCEAWTMPEPGPAYDLTFCEVRDTSLVLLWKPPVYSGSSPVSGYFVDYKEEDSGEWLTVHETATPHRYLKVCDLHQGKTYVFRVRAVNASGVGRPSDTSEPVLVEARPGTKEVSAGVDEEGNVYLSFDCPEVTDASHFTWCKSYEDIADDDRFKVETAGDHSKLYFKNLDKEDLGTYSVSVSDTDGVSSSFVLDEEELERLKALSNEIKNPTIPLKSELAYEIFDKGQVRFWLQAEHLSPDSSYRFIINDREVADSETHRIKCDKSTGIIEMVMDRFTIDNEGTYTVQIQDGKAKSQSSLVLIGDAFKAVLKEAEFQRKEFLRKQGPHFAEYLHWDVTEECEVRLVCKVANTKKETVFKWLKDDVLYETEKMPDLEKGLSKKDHGEYKATLKDDRGQDVSTLEIAGKVYEDMILAMSRVCGASASPLKILCTPEGIRLQCFMKYFTEEMKVNWYHKDAKITSSEHMRIGGSEQMAWLQICEPTEKDKGKYTFEILDGKKNHQRSLDLSGQAFDEAFAEFQQLKWCSQPSCFPVADRGKVIGGLPDVTLNLTCTVFGNPDPEVVWFKNDKDIELSDHFSVKVEQAKYVSMTIKGVTSEDSGKYSIHVKNKYGGEKIDVTVSVYKHGEEIPDVVLPQQAKPKLLPAAAPSPAH
ncbi:hypothetical protein E5288_WYG021620 [Bos mutus]|uniref:Myomesin-2 n=1 Tax=Bos mutus TaxID=72004 RepID=A0A6B0S3G3_9CETA|nr:hypothetical protein [Bos mutus]